MRPQDPEIKIEYLAAHPHLADELARFSWGEWQRLYEQRGQTFDDALETYRARIKTDSLPLALVAFVGDEVIGTVSLKPQDLDIRPTLTPWLGGLYVVPPWRGRGIGTLLMRRAVEEARRLARVSNEAGSSTLYLWTASAEALYHKLGWQPLERTDYRGKRIVVMEYDLSSA